ncbi:scoloptoxin SSD976-like [Amblyomma americanum]
MNRLVWDSKLAKKAHKTAEFCDLTREGNAEDLKAEEGDPEGNIGQKTGSAAVTGDQASPVGIAVIENWIKAKDRFDVAGLEKYVDPADADAKRFAQLIWATTLRVGCSYIQFTSKVQPAGGAKELLVCDYHPGGREKDQPVYMKGDPCTQCANGRQCDEAIQLCKGEDSDIAVAQEAAGSGISALGIGAAVVAVLVAVVGVFCGAPALPQAPKPPRRLEAPETKEPAMTAPSRKAPRGREARRELSRPNDDVLSLAAFCARGGSMRRASR